MGARKAELVTKLVVDCQTLVELSHDRQLDAETTNKVLASLESTLSALGASNTVLILDPIEVRRALGGRY